MSDLYYGHGIMITIMFHESLKQLKSMCKFSPLVNIYAITSI